MSKKIMLTAFSKDRPGIVADISQIIYENGYNLEDSARDTLVGLPDFQRPYVAVVLP